MARENKKKVGVAKVVGAKVVVAMSGGVDSSVAAALLVEQGFDVIGISMQLWDYSEPDALGDGQGDGIAVASTAGSCCSLDDLQDARRVCDKLGIPFYVANLEEVFEREVVDYFIDSYLSGETPNPCVKCNDVMKFQVLLQRARELDADYLATGHYVRIEPPTDEGEGYRLLKGVDSNKDQSYFLFTMTQGQLARTLFPVGDITKDEVRRLAAKVGLKVADKKESQEICFIDGDYGEFLAERLERKADNAQKVGKALTEGTGDIVDDTGRVVGKHKGLFRYTIGQRRGLDIKDGGGPYYVLGTDPKSNRLVVGKNSELFVDGLICRELNWISGDAPEPGEMTVKIRYRHEGVLATIEKLEDGTARVIFKEAQRSVTPGQAVVFYDGDIVLGGGWIERAIKARTDNS